MWSVKSPPMIIIAYWYSLYNNPCFPIIPFLICSSNPIWGACALTILVSLFLKQVLVLLFYHLTTSNFCFNYYSYPASIFFLCEPYSISCIFKFLNFSPTHFVSCKYAILVLLLIIVSTISTPILKMFLWSELPI